jgi:Tol biopolymer transport system component
MKLIRALPLALVLAVACSGKGSQPASLSAATVQGASPDDSTVVVRRIAIDSGEFVYQLGTPTRDGRFFSGLDAKTGNLAVRDMRTSERRLLTSDGNWGNSAYALSSLISPNGRSLAFVWSVGQPTFKGELRTIGIDGSGERTLVKSGDQLEYAYPADWSPDGGNLLAIMYRKDNSNQIAFISTADGSVRVLKSLDWRSPQGLKFSPDGRWVAYDFQRERENGGRDLFVLQADGSRETRITSDDVPKSLVGWSPDGLGLYYGVKRNDATTIWYVPVREGRAAGKPRVIRSDIWGASTIGLAGASLYYLVSDYKRTIYTVAVDLDGGRVLAPPTPILTESFGMDGSGISRAIRWSPDGNHLAFTRTLEAGGPSRVLIVIRDIPTGAERELPLSLENVALQRWLPDGRAMIISAAKRGQSGRYRVDLATGKAELTDQVAAVGEIPGPSPDGKTEYHIRTNSSHDSATVIAKSVETSQEREIYRGRRLTGLRLSPDGQSLAFVTDDLRKSDANLTATLVVIPAAGGEPHVLLSQDPPRFIGDMNWSSDSRHLLFTAGTVGAVRPVNELWMATPRTGEAQKLLLVKEGLFTRPVLSPDGRRVAYVVDTGGNTSELWVMENLPGSAKKSPGGAR